MTMSVRSPTNAVRLTPVWAALFGTRLPVLLVGYLAVVTIGVEAGRPPARVYANELLNLASRWDTDWYLDIATRGYRWAPASADHKTSCTIPRVSDADAGRRLAPGECAAHRRRPHLVDRLLLGAGVSLSTRVRRARRGRRLGDGRLVRQFPFAVFFSAAYTESLFLLASVAAFVHARRRQPVRTAAWGLLAGLTRPQGFLLTLPLAWIALSGQGRQDHIEGDAAGGGRRGRLANAAAAAAPCVVC